LKDKNADGASNWLIPLEWCIPKMRASLPQANRQRGTYFRNALLRGSYPFLWLLISKYKFGFPTNHNMMNLGKGKINVSNNSFSFGHLITQMPLLLSNELLVLFLHILYTITCLGIHLLKNKKPSIWCCNSFHSLLHKDPYIHKVIYSY
jgi:hypothetical protein